MDDYLSTADPVSSGAARQWGYPMNVWNVSLIENFSELFDVSRITSAVNFNEDISGWDTSRAVSMRQMFHGTCISLDFPFIFIRYPDSHASMNNRRKEVQPANWYMVYIASDGHV